MSSRYETAEWLELSGLPARLNTVRTNGWLVFKKIVELDCRRNREPEAVECSLQELGERCGLDWEKVAKTVEALRKKKFLSCFLPDNPDELGLFLVRAPIATPRGPEEVARAAHDPQLRDPTTYRYTKKPEESEPDLKKVQKIIDLYLNSLSQRMNSFIVDEIEILARRFPLAAIEKTIERAARHEIRTIGWVAKELIRDSAKEKKKAKAPQ